MKHEHVSRMGDKENVGETGLDTELILAFKSRTSGRCFILIPQMSNAGTLHASVLSKYATYNIKLYVCLTSNYLISRNINNPSISNI